MSSDTGLEARAKKRRLEAGELQRLRERVAALEALCLEASASVGGEWMRERLARAGRGKGVT